VSRFVSRTSLTSGSRCFTPASTSANAVTPADFVATIYHCLGIDPAGEIHDQTNRPIALSKGAPIAALMR
jgi:hypothetical protein